MPTISKYGRISEAKDHTQTYYIHTYMYRVKWDSTPTVEPSFQVYPFFGQYYTDIAEQQTMGRTGSNNHVNEVR